MKILNTAELDREALTPYQTAALYNGMDCLMTHEVFATLKPLLDPVTQVTYNFERALMGPVLEMMIRGTRVNYNVRNRIIADCKQKLQRLQYILNKFSVAVWDQEMNAKSPQQKAELLYDVMQLPKQFKRNVNGERVVTTERKALEKLKGYFYARPIINTILAIMDNAKRLGTLKMVLDPDGYMRCSYMIAGTETGRLASKVSAFGTGTNKQNQEDRLREMQTCERGEKLAYVDLEQAESRLVGALVFTLFGDSAYLDACEGGDLHTEVARMVWPDLPWTGDIKADRKIADDSSNPFYRNFTFRDMAKRGGHGTNYFGTAFTMAAHLNVEQEVMEAFQARYFAAFPGIQRWHQWVIEQLQLEGQITTLMGRRRFFFGRRTDDATIREAIAYEPQSVATGDYMNLGLLKLWRSGLPVAIRDQVHDAVAFTYQEADESWVLPEAAKCLETEFTITSPSGERRPFSIPTEVLVGWNLAKRKVKRDGTVINPDGLLEWKGNDERKRTTYPPKSVLDRVVF